MSPRRNYTLLPSDDPPPHPRAMPYGAPQGKTALDRKTAVISRALDDTGMGRYQWCIFFLCGFGYALDLMWAQAFSLVTPRIQQELGVSDKDYGDIFSVFSAGLTVGAFTWGIFVDIIGRRWAFNLTVAIVAVFGMIIGALDTWAAICALTFFVGFGLGGNIPIDATIVLEFIPNDRRYLLAALSVFQPLGVIITSLISWALIPHFACAPDLPSCANVSDPSSSTCCTKRDNYGWRYTLFALGGLSVLAFLARFVLFSFHESPKFLVAKGRDRQAVEVVRAVAKFNGKRVGLAVEHLEACERVGNEEDVNDSASGSEEGEVREKKVRRVPGGHLRMLFGTWIMARLTVLTWICYAADYWGFVIAGNFLPKFLAERGAAAELSVYDTYRNYIVIAVVGVPGVLLGTALIEVPRVGRRWAMVASSALMGASLFMFSVVRTPAASVGFGAIEYFFQSTFNAVLYGWTPEAFPASVRGSACGLASFWGRLSSIVAPLIAAHIDSAGGDGTRKVLFLAGGGVFVCTVVAAFLPETKDAGE